MAKHMKSQNQILTYLLSVLVGRVLTAFFLHTLTALKMDQPLIDSQASQILTPVVLIP